MEPCEIITGISLYFHTNNSVTANQVTFDADEDDLTGSEPDDETATLFQAVLNVDSDDEADSTHRDPAPLPYPAQVDETDDDEEREYYTDVIDGVRTLRYSVVVPPDGPPASLDLAPTDNSGNANEQRVHTLQPDSRWGENAKTTGMETSTNSDATQSSSVERGHLPMGRRDIRTYLGYVAN